MPYRPQKRSTPTGARNGNGTHHRPSYGVRLAISRARARKPADKGGGGAILAVALVLVVSVLGVVSLGAILTGGAAAVTIATLEQDLPDVQEFRDLDFSEPTRIMDRTGKVELAQFWDERREVIEYEDIPPLVLDVTTAVEDDTFWDNPGFDLEATINAFLTEAGGGGDRGGGSTITQQLVRARLLPEDVVSAGLSTREGLYTRKAKELLQAYKLTQAFSGEEGKKAIITAYLNEISYGTASGIAAAAEIYLGKKLSELTVSEAALLAAIPQSPSVLYPWAKDSKGRYSNIVKEAGKKRTKGGKRHVRFVLKTCPASDEKCVDTPLVQRRDYVLGRLRDGKGRWTTLSDEQYQQALNEKIVIKKPKASTWEAPHFVNALLPELDQHPGGPRPDQERWLHGHHHAGHAGTAPRRAAHPGGRGPAEPALCRCTTGSSTRSGCAGTPAGSATCAAPASATAPWWRMDYRSGDILAYVGSAGYYRRETREFAPKVDHVGRVLSTARLGLEAHRLRHRDRYASG